MITVVEHNQIDAINAIRDDWHKLLAESPRASFLHTPEWLEAYWKFFAADQQLKILVVQENQNIIGIVPLILCPLSTKVGQLQLLTSLDDWGDYSKPIGADKTTIIQATCEYIKNAPRDWDLFEPRWVDETNLQNGDIYSAVKKGGLTPYVSEWSLAALVDLTGTIDQYWENWTTKQLSEQRRNERRLAKRGQIKYLRHRPKPGGDPRWDLLEDCQKIAQESWQANSTTGTTLSHDSVQDFMKYIHEVATNIGCLDMNLLYQDNEPIAFSYGYHLHGQVDGLKIGFVRNKKTNGAGRVLIAHIIADSFERKDVTFNMGSGKHDWKQLWQTESAMTYQYSCFSSQSLRSQLLKINHWAHSAWQHLRASALSKDQNYHKQNEHHTKQMSSQFKIKSHS